MYVWYVEEEGREGRKGGAGGEDIGKKKRKEIRGVCSQRETF